MKNFGTAFSHFQGPKKPQRPEEESERSLEAEDEGENQEFEGEDDEEEEENLLRRSDHPAVDFYLILNNYKRKY